MGHGIAQVSAMAGYNVVLRDIEQKFLDKAMEKVKWSLDKLVSKEKISQTEAETCAIPWPIIPEPKTVIFFTGNKFRNY